MCKLYIFSQKSSRAAIHFIENVNYIHASEMMLSQLLTGSRDIKLVCKRNLILDVYVLFVYPHCIRGLYIFANTYTYIFGPRALILNTSAIPNN